MRSPVQIRLAAPHSRKASLATPRKFLRGVRVYACGCVNASQKYGRSPRSSFLCIAPKLSRCSLIFAPRDGGSRRFFTKMSGFCVVARTGFSPFADAIFSPTRKIKDFSRGDPEAPCVNSARRTDGARCAIPSLRSLQIRLAAPHSRKASLATPRKNLRGVCVFTPPKILSAGTPYVPAAVFPQKVNARRSLAPRFLTLLENYPPFTHFPFAGLFVLRRTQIRG